MVDRAEILLMAEYAVPFPLWAPLPAGGWGWIQHFDGLGLTDALVADLLGWQAYFTEHFSVTHWDGWRPRQSAGEFARRGQELRARLAAELPRTTITLDLWPVNAVT